MRRFVLLFLFLPAAVSALQQNLLLITIDTLRADHLGCYGYAGARTPNLDVLARDSLFFENAVCQAPLTLPSHTSLMTGRYPYHHGVHDNAGSVDPRETTLAEVLLKSGYHTYAFVGGFPLDHRFGLNQGFDIYNDLFPRQKNRSLDFRSERNADAVVNAVQSTQITEPFFVWVHFYDPHAPYSHGGYDGEIEFVDQQVGILLRKFNSFHPVIAVAGDHGESLGEHGELTHRIFVYDSTMRVPFWIKAAGVPSQRIKSQVRLIDFLPTVLSFMNIPVPSGLDGVVLPKNVGAPAYLESLFSQLQLGWSALYAIRTEEWKFIQAPSPELYHLTTDPQEKNNLFVKEPEIVKLLTAKLPSISTQNKQSEVSPEMAERLASLGYVSGKSSAGASKVDPKDRIAVWNQIEMAVDLEKTRSTEAISILEKAQKADPDNPMVLGFLAQKYAEANRFEDARSILRKVLTQDPKNALALYRMAVVSLGLGLGAEAKKWAESLRELEPTNADACILLARALLKTGDVSAAIESLIKALEIDPLDLDLRNDLANLFLQQQNREAARSEFQRVLKADDRNVQALNGLATCLFLSEDYESSEGYLKQALQIDPADPQTKMNLALLYSKQGKTKEAIALYQDVESSPRTPSDWKAEAKARLKELVP